MRLRPPTQVRSSRCSTTSTASSAPSRRARSMPTRQVKGLLGKRRRRGRPPTPPPSSRSASSTRPRSRSCPGEAFGSPGYLRLSYALGDDDLVEGVSPAAEALRLSGVPGRDLADPSEGTPASALHRLDATPDACSTSPTRDGIALPDALVEDWPPTLSAADEKGWFRFQRLYDVARSVLRTEDDVRRLVTEAAEDDGATAADGWRSRSTRADTPRGSTESPPSPSWSSMRSRDASETVGIGIGGRDRGEPHPAPSGRSYAGPSGQPVRRSRGGRLRAVQRRAPRGAPREFASAFRIAERAGLLLTPHGGELLGAESVRICRRRAACRSARARRSGG